MTFRTHEQAIARIVETIESADGERLAYLPLLVQARQIAAEVRRLRTDPAPVDWPARFRAAATVVSQDGWGNYAVLFACLAGDVPKCEVPPDVVQAIGRALLTDPPTA